jgi:hypothetical protein
LASVILEVTHASPMVNCLLPAEIILKMMIFQVQSQINCFHAENCIHNLPSVIKVRKFQLLQSILSLSVPAKDKIFSFFQRSSASLALFLLLPSEKLRYPNSSTAPLYLERRFSYVYSEPFHSYVSRLFFFSFVRIRV